MSFIKEVLSALFNFFLFYKKSGKVEEDKSAPKYEIIEDDVTVDKIKFDESVNPSSWEKVCTGGARIEKGLVYILWKEGMNPIAKFQKIQHAGWDKPSYGNWWIGGKIDGEWHATTCEYIGDGNVSRLDLKAKLLETGGWGSHSNALKMWFPGDGEEVLVFATTFARQGIMNGKMRSKVFKVKWSN